MPEASSVNSVERSPVSGLTPAGVGLPVVPGPGEWQTPIAPPPPEDYTVVIFVTNASSALQIDFSTCFLWSP